MSDVKLDTTNLDAFLKILKDEYLPKARVGILGSKTVRNNTAIDGKEMQGRKVNAGKGVMPKTKGKIDFGTNAAIGAAHEFGTSKLPVRSFLRIPISENLQTYLENSGAFDKDTLKEVLEQGTTINWVKKCAAIAETIVLDAFDTGGFGKWTPSDMTHKKNHQTLVETQQLRNSITSEVSE